MKHFNATQNVKKRIEEVLGELAEILSKSYSPYGSSSIMIEKNRVSKDGYEILNSLNPEDEFTAYVTNLVRSLTNKTLFTAGDGKTTAVLLANALFNNLDEIFKEHYNNKTSQEFIMDVNDVAAVTLNRLNEIKYIPENKEDYLNVAHTSLNNDDQLIKYIEKAINELPESDSAPQILTAKNTDSARTYVDAVKGYKIPKSLDYGMRSDTGLFEDFRVLVLGERLESNDQLEKIHEIMEFCSDENQRLVIIYPDANGYAKRMIRNKIQSMHMENKPLTTVFMKFSSGGTLDMEQFYEDFMAYLGTITLNVKEDNFLEYFKNNYKSLSLVDLNTKQHNTIFIVKERSEDVLYEERIDELQRKIKDTDGNEKEQAEQRLQRLTMTTVTIRVGANTPEDRDRIFNMFQDATLAIKHSADGIVAGMNTAVPKAISTIDFKEEFMPIVKAVERSYIDLLNIIIEKSRREVSDDIKKEITKFDNGGVLKAYDVKAGEITTNILNSFKAEKVILEAALEIVKILITSNQIIFSDTYARNYYENQDKTIESTPVKKEIKEDTE